MSEWVENARRRLEAKNSYIKKGKKENRKRRKRRKHKSNNEEEK